ncbi:uncharacterized protein DC041_0001737, partial [Schistosoma bovis]
LLKICTFILTHGNPQSLLSDPCGVQNGYVSPSNNGLRSYLYADGYLFYCDEFPTTIKSYLTEKRCFVTYNNADMKWTGQNDDSILLSSDYGERWTSTNLYTQVKLTRNASYYINSTIIPWTYAAGYFDQSITGISCQLYQQSSYQCQLLISFNQRRLAYELLSLDESYFQDRVIKVTQTPINRHFILMLVVYRPISLTLIILFNLVKRR